MYIVSSSTNRADRMRHLEGGPSSYSPDGFIFTGDEHSRRHSYFQYAQSPVSAYKLKKLRTLSESRRRMSGGYEGSNSVGLYDTTCDICGKTYKNTQCLLKHR